MTASITFGMFCTHYDFMVILGASSAAAKVRACDGFITSSGLHGQKTPHASAVRRITVLARACLAEVHESPRLPRVLHLRISSNRLLGQKPRERAQWW